MTPATAAPPLMTAEEFLALPDDGMERWLIRGQLREKSMTTRNPWHCLVTGRVAQQLWNWIDSQPEPRGWILTGDARIRFRDEPASVVGIDLAYISAGVVRQVTANTTVIEVAPILAVEILSPSDTEEEINEKTDLYLERGVQVIWVIDPHDRTIIIYRPNVEPTMVTASQELTGEPELPGFRVAAGRLFG
jgi:Uma2 family endonuclease